MKTSLGSWRTFLVLLIATAFPDDVYGTVKPCDHNKEREVTAEDAITLVRPLLCEKPLVFNVYGHTVVRSRHSINTTNVHFVVHPSATLTMKARAISMGRNEASTLPVIKVFGNVTFDARSWTPSYANGTQEDSGDLVRVFKGGIFDSSQPVRFTTSTFVVANEQARDGKESLHKLSPHLEELLTEFHARNGTETGPPDNSSSSSSNSDASAPGDMHVGRSGIEASRKTESVVLLPNNVTLDLHVSQRVQGLKMRNQKTNVKNDAVSESNFSRHSESNHLTENHVMLCPKDPWASKPSCALHVGETLTGPLRSAGGRSVLWPRADGSLMFGKYQETPSTEGGVGREVAGPEAMRFTTLLHSDMHAVRKVFGMRRSKVRAFIGKGGNDSGRKTGMARGWSLLVQRSENDSIGSVGATRDLPDDAERQDSGRKMGTAGGWLPLARNAKKKHLGDTVTSTDKVGSHTEVVRKALGKQTTKVRDMGSKVNDDESGTEMETAGGWLPWGRREEKTRLGEIGTAADKTGKVCASVSNKGCVKVTVDGTTVLSKSGPYTWDWINRLPWTRPTDDGYEVHVTDDGMEVRLGEKTVWSINADEWIG